MSNSNGSGLKNWIVRTVRRTRNERSCVVVNAGLRDSFEGKACSAYGYVRGIRDAPSKGGGM